MADIFTGHGYDKRIIKNNNKYKLLCSADEKIYMFHSSLSLLNTQPPLHSMLTRTTPTIMWCVHAHLVSTTPPRTTFWSKPVFIRTSLASLTIQTSSKSEEKVFVQPPPSVPVCYLRVHWPGNLAANSMNIVFVSSIHPSIHQYLSIHLSIQTILLALLRCSLTCFILSTTKLNTFSFTILIDLFLFKIVIHAWLFCHFVDWSYYCLQI